MPDIDADQQWMERALLLAERAEALGEVPVGAVVIVDSQLLGEGWNSPISSHDPTAHAEIVALRAASQKIRNYRLPGSTMYVTIEPCTMCAGALVHARVERLVFGAREPRAGAVVSNQQVLDGQQLNHRVTWTEGVLRDNCSQLLQTFFAARRAAQS